MVKATRAHHDLPVAASAAQGSVRLHYIDWLRVLAVLLLFPFHTLRVYNAGEAFYVKGAQLSVAVDAVVDFVGLWHMPLLMLLAGCSTYFALRKRGPRQYLGERLVRLGVPFVFGLLVLCPPQCWYGGRFNSGYMALVLELPDQRRLLQVRHSGLRRRLRHVSAVVHPGPAAHFDRPAAAVRVGKGRRRRGDAEHLARPRPPLWWPLLPFVLAVGYLAPDPPPSYLLNFEPSVAYYLMFFALAIWSSATAGSWPRPCATAGGRSPSAPPWRSFGGEPQLARN